MSSNPLRYPSGELIAEGDICLWEEIESRVEAVIADSATATEWKLEECGILLQNDPLGRVFVGVSQFEQDRLRFVGSNDPPT